MNASAAPTKQACEHQKASRIRGGGAAKVRYKVQYENIVSNDLLRI